jgi:hypothetical protein
MSVLLLLAVVAILGGVVFVALGRGGELALFPPDAGPGRARLACADDVATFRPPPAFLGYSASATDEALSRIALVVAQRDEEVAALRRQLAAYQSAAYPAAYPAAEATEYGPAGEYGPGREYGPAGEYGAERGATSEFGAVDEYGPAGRLGAVSEYGGTSEHDTTDEYGVPSDPDETSHDGATSERDRDGRDRDRTDEYGTLGAAEPGWPADSDRPGAGEESR